MIRTFSVKWHTTTSPASPYYHGTLTVNLNTDQSEDVDAIVDRAKDKARDELIRRSFQDCAWRVVIDSAELKP